MEYKKEVLHNGAAPLVLLKQVKFSAKGFPSRGSCHGTAKGGAMTDEVCSGQLLLLLHYGEFVPR